MDDHARHAVGVDISNAHLDAHRLPDGGEMHFGNDAKGFEELAMWAGAADVVVYVRESTGHGHRDFEEALAGRLPLARVDVMRARRFAQTMGEQVKTDAVGARVLATMGATLRLRQVAARSPAQRDLDELITARNEFVRDRDRVAALNRQKHVRHNLFKRQNCYRLQQIDRQIKVVDAEIDKLLAADPELVWQAGAPAAIPGVGPVTAADELIVEMPEQGACDAKATASLAGLAPMALLVLANALLPQNRLWTPRTDAKPLAGKAEGAGDPPPPPPPRCAESSRGSLLLAPI